MTTTDSALAHELLESIGSLRRRLRRGVGRPWPMGSVSGAQVDLLRVVRRQPDISVAAAAEELGVAANTVSTLVRQLAEAGMLRRVPDPGDRRVAQLRLTPAAQDRIERWRDERAAVLTTALSQLSESDRDDLARAVTVLGRLAAELRVEEVS